MMRPGERGLADIDAEDVKRVCGDAAHTRELCAWMARIVDESNRLQSALADGGDEDVGMRLGRLAVQISLCMRIGDAARRALSELEGKPPSGEARESARGGVL